MKLKHVGIALLCVGSGVLSARLTILTTVVGQADPERPSAVLTGDTNGDGETDIGDVVHLLFYLKGLRI